MREQFTAQERKAIQGYKDGRYSVAGVSSQLGISRHYAEQLLRRAEVSIRSPFEEALARHSRDGRPTRPDLTKAEIDQTVAAYEAGKIASQQDAATALGISQQTFRRYLIQRGIKPRSRLEVIGLQSNKRQTAKPPSRPQPVQTPKNTSKPKISREDWPEDWIISYDDVYPESSDQTED